MYPSQSSIAIHGLDDGSPIARANVRQIAPITALVSGPTNAIQNSTFALTGFFSICETPPRANSVISFTGRLFDGRHQRMRQLMQQQRDEEQDGRRNGQGQDDAVAPLRDCWHGTARKVKTR